MKKKLIIPISLISFVALVAVIYVSYGFVAARITNNELSKKQTFINQKLEIEYSDGTETLTSNNTSFIPGSILTKEISITNTGNVPVTYTIKIGDCLPEDESKCVFENTFKRPADITYEMYLNNEIIEKTTFPIYKDEPLASNITIDKDETQNLKLLIYYNNSTDNQIVDSGSKIGGKLTFEDEKNIIENVLIYGNTDENTSTSLGENGEITLSVNRNLVKNGFGEYGDSTNFSDFKYQNSDLLKGKGYFSIEHTSGLYKFIRIGNKIPIDPKNNRYYYKYSLSSKSEIESGVYEVGLRTYDIGFKTDEVDGTSDVVVMSVNFVSGSTTTLAQDLKPESTIIYLSSVSGFKFNLRDDDKMTIEEQKDYYYHDGLIFWNYEKDGIKYGVEEYSKNFIYNLFELTEYDGDVGVDYVNNTIVLSKPFGEICQEVLEAGYGKMDISMCSQTIPAGTPLSQTRSGQGITVKKTFTLSPNIWTNAELYLEGYSNNIHSVENFWYGSSYVTPIFCIYKDFIGELNVGDIIFNNLNHIIENKIILSSPLSCFDGICDYIDIKNKRVVRKVSNGSILSTPTYEEIDVPDLSLFTSKMITVSDGNIEASDIKVEYK